MSGTLPPRSCWKRASCACRLLGRLCSAPSALWRPERHHCRGASPPQRQRRPPPRLAAMDCSGAARSILHRLAPPLRLSPRLHRKWHGVLAELSIPCADSLVCWHIVCVCFLTHALGLSFSRAAHLCGSSPSRLDGRVPTSSRTVLSLLPLPRLSLR